MASKMAVAQAIRAETTGDELMDLLVFVARMPETQLSVLQEADTSKFIVDFVRQLKAAGVSTVTVPDVDCPRDQQGGLHLAWVGIPLMVLVLVVDHGISIVDEIKQCTKAFLERNNVALATAYHGVHGVGLVASVGLGVVAAVHSCIKHLKVQPGRPRVSRLKRPKQQLDLAPASAGGMLPAAGTSTMGQVDTSQDS